MPEKWHEIISENIIKNNGLPYEVEGLRKDGSIFPIEIEAKELSAFFEYCSVRKNMNNVFFDMVTATDEEAEKSVDRYNEALLVFLQRKKEVQKLLEESIRRSTGLMSKVSDAMAEERSVESERMSILGKFLKSHGAEAIEIRENDIK